MIYCGEEAVGRGEGGSSMIDSPASRTINSHFCCLFIPLKGVWFVTDAGSYLT